jgi:hypothetical protein
MKTLDAGNSVNKMQIKASISATIADQVKGSILEDIAGRVEETYEKLLVGAALTEHVPSLTAGIVKREVVKSMHQRW